jgi:hypothetical protein
VKRSLSILSVFVLLAFLFSFGFAPVVKAEGNTTNNSDTTTSAPANATSQSVDQSQQNPATTSSDQQADKQAVSGGTGQEGKAKAGEESGKKEKQYKIRLRFDAKVVEDENGGEPKIIPVLIAKLIDKTDKEVNEVNGTWTVFVDDQEYKKFENSKDKKIRVELPEEFNSVKVVFEGTIDGDVVKVHKKYAVTNADVEISHQEVNGKDEFTATIKGVEQAQGHWFLAYGDDQDMIDFAEGDGGATFTHTFEDIKPGKYLVVAVFEGTINDGDYVVLGNTMEFEKKDNGSGEIKPPSDNNGDKQPKPPVLPPDDTHKQIEEGKKGGKLPKTATTYPAGALAGLMLLVVGFAALKLRRA